MPFKSQAQARKMYELHKQGKIKYDTLKEFVRSTPDISKLPERVKPKKDDGKTDLALKGLV